MSLNQLKRRWSPWIFYAATIISMLSIMSMLMTLQRSIYASQDDHAGQEAAVPKGKEPVDAIVTVVSMSRERWDGLGVGHAFEILLLRVEKVLGESKVPPYVRVDFENLSVLANSKETRAYLQLLSSLREPKLWKIHLRPPRGTGDCWAIPPPPIPGDLMSSRNPVMVPVGGASGYPDINGATCYIANQDDLREVVSPSKSE
jgi:hypothetical protein